VVSSVTASVRIFKPFIAGSLRGVGLPYALQALPAGDILHECGWRMLHRRKLGVARPPAKSEETALAPSSIIGNGRSARCPATSAPSVLAAWPLLGHDRLAGSLGLIKSASGHIDFSDSERAPSAIDSACQ
jgi:hypothetical protein